MSSSFEFFYVLWYYFFMSTIFNDVLSKMILSASGWRTVFAKSGNEEDNNPELTEEHKSIAFFAAQTFARYCKNQILQKKVSIVVGMDARPTGINIADMVIKALEYEKCSVHFLGVSAAPEIMAYSKAYTGFIYISASHNPIGHNGIKFGLNDGGVLSGEESKILIELFKSACCIANPVEAVQSLCNSIDNNKIKKIYENQRAYKKNALESYTKLTREVISNAQTVHEQDNFITLLKNQLQQKPLTIVCDMNGSARTVSIDKEFLQSFGIDFFAINDTVGNIAHAIIPEPENLVHVAKKLEQIQHETKQINILGYMPDCDGDRGNIVYWDTYTQTAKILKAQEVFALSVLSELAYNYYRGKTKNLAVAVNCPTSMRIEEIASFFNAQVARAEVGEANVVNKARALRNEGFIVPILGEGSNGGNITYPAAVRDPINTLFALIKLLFITDTPQKNGLFHLWCKISNQEHKYTEQFTLADILNALPIFTTTGVSEAKALLKIKTSNHAVLKQNFQYIFEKQWQEKKEYLYQNFLISSYEAIGTLGTQELHNLTDFSLSKTGGLKILFKDDKNSPLAYFWMRGSGTEPVFRILADVKGKNQLLEKELIEWETLMLEKADNM